MRTALAKLVSRGISPARLDLFVRMRHAPVVACAFRRIGERSWGSARRFGSRIGDRERTATGACSTIGSARAGQ